MGICNRHLKYPPGLCACAQLPAQLPAIHFPCCKEVHIDGGHTTIIRMPPALCLGTFGAETKIPGLYPGYVGALRKRTHTFLEHPI